ncbi:MAG: hypothetical protein E7223_04010 [Clostridiales bacterium]|nr:hypothetical protein [Clostridiales bacterium]
MAKAGMLIGLFGVIFIAVACEWGTFLSSILAMLAAGIGALLGWLLDEKIKEKKDTEAIDHIKRTGIKDLEPELYCNLVKDPLDNISAVQNALVKIIEAGADIVLASIGPNDSKELVRYVALCKGVTFSSFSNRELTSGLSETQYALWSALIVSEATYKKNVNVTANAVAGGIIAGSTGAIVGAVSAANANANGGKLYHSYTSTNTYNLFSGDRQVPDTRVFLVAGKKGVLQGILSKKQYELKPEIVAIVAAGLNKAEANELKNFLNYGCVSRLSAKASGAPETYRKEEVKQKEPTSTPWMSEWEELNDED